MNTIYLKMLRTFYAPPLLFFLFSFLIENCVAQQWYHQIIPRGRHINSVKIFDSLRIVIGGGNESNDSLRDIFVSPDKGLSWEISSTGTPNGIAPWIKSMAFSDTLHGIAVGYTGTILKTINSAADWNQVPFPINRQFMKVTYASPQIVYVVGGSIPRQDTLQTIIKSTDSGRTWTVQLDRRGFWLRGVAFTDINHGIAVGDSGVILRTTNGGVNWSTISSPVNRTWNQVKFINPSVGYLVGGIASPDSVSTIMRTADSGKTWTVIKNDLIGTLTDIMFLTSTTGYISGDHGTLLKTTNGGLNWSPVNIPGTTHDMTFNTVDFYSDQFGVVSGQHGETFIFTISTVAEAYTLNSQLIDSTSANLTGGVNTHNEIAVYSFNFSEDSTFNSYANTYPVTTRSTFVKQITAQIDHLDPDTTYYYFLTVQTLAGSVNGDTLKFFTGIPHSIVHTSEATNVTTTTALINGIIDKVEGAATISFDYGITPAFDSSTSATPDSISDTLQHIVSAAINSLRPFTTYYFRLKVTQLNHTYYGETRIFFTGDIYKTLRTDAASNIRDSSVTLNGFIDKFRQPVSLSFEYGNTALLGFEVGANPSSVNDSSSHTITMQLNNLPPASLYYYRIKSVTPATTSYGAIIPFYSGIGYSFFITADATNIGSGSAQLNAVAKRFASNVSLSFEYGVDTTFGSEISATPPNVNDTLFHNISATVTGLIPDHLYYFRSKATDGSINIYGGTRQFYAGLSEVPNWDFQYWRIDTVEIPNHWNLLDQNFMRVPGHSGNYAIKLFARTFILNGFVGDGGPQFAGGTPLDVTTPPDSLVFYANYNIETGDTGLALLYLKKLGRPLVIRFLPITGNSGGVFKRLAYKIDYDSLAVPDTIISAFISTNLLSGKGTLNNLISIDDISLEPGHHTFVNGDFEDWFTTSIERPESWFNIRFIGLDPAIPDSNHMVSKVYFNEPDDFAAEVRNIAWTQQGIIIGGELNNKESPVIDDVGGFPVRGRHTTFNGYYKFFPMPGDTLQITLSMKKNGIQIGNGIMIVGDSAKTFKTFSVPIVYDSQFSAPDSAMIGFRIEGPNLKAGSRFVVDKLSFDGFMPVGVRSETLELDGMKVYPNPARDHIIIENNFPGNKKCTLSLFDLKGELISETDMTANPTAEIDVTRLPRGMYILVMKKGDQIFNKKIVIQ